MDISKPLFERGSSARDNPSVRDWYNKVDNLEPMCRECNNDIDRVTKWVVQPAFRGKGDAPPDPNDQAG